ncbi:MAG: VWA domain-containing protein [Rikenellaceae bacterium]
MFTFDRFADANMLYLLLVLLPMIGYYIFRERQGGASVTISTIDGFKNLYRTPKYYLRHLPFVFKLLAVSLLIVALARPQTRDESSTSKSEGIDIVLAIDVSTSMLARDFEPDRLSAAKAVASEFIADRVNDRIGLVVFAGESFTQSPLTTDKASLQTLLAQVKDGIIEDGTAIGNGLATSVNRLKNSTAKSKVVILLTDGVNNRGQVAPLTAAEIAKTFGIKVYTIGVGTEGNAPYPTLDVFGNIRYQSMKVEIDEQVLTQIAESTNGKYFRATDNEKLHAIYDQINELETTEVEVENYVRYDEKYVAFLMFAMMCLLFEFLLKYLWLRQIP